MIDSNEPQREMPRYQSHKKVWALKIKAVSDAGVDDKTAVITPADEGFASFKVDAEYVAKHNPQSGGYYVRYQDGYESFSPAEAFESGYTKL